MSGGLISGWRMSGGLKSYESATHIPTALMFVSFFLDNQMHEIYP